MYTSLGLGLLAKPWLNISFALHQDPDAHEVLGWTAELYAFSIAAAITPATVITPIRILRNRCSDALGDLVVILPILAIRRCHVPGNGCFSFVTAPFRARWGRSKQHHLSR